MPLVEAMETQRAVRRLRPDPVDDDTVLARPRARHQGADGQQPAGLGVRGRARPRREAPARPPQPPGLVDLPPHRQAPGQGATSPPSRSSTRCSGRPTTSRRSRSSSWPASTGARPSSGRRSWPRAGTARPSRRCRTCCSRPGPSASAPPSRPCPSGPPRWPAAPSASPRTSPRWPSSPWAGPRGGYGPTTRKPVADVVHLDRYGNRAVPVRLLLPELQPPGAPVAAAPRSAVRCLARQVTTCREKDELAGSAKRGN